MSRTQEQILEDIFNQILSYAPTPNFNQGSGPSTNTAGSTNQTGTTTQQTLADLGQFATGTPRDAKKAFDVYLAGVNDTFSGFAKNYAKINETIGGYTNHKDLVNSTQTTMKEAVYRLDEYIDAYGATTDEFIKIQREKGDALTAEEEKRIRTVGIDFVTKYFKSGEEAATIQADILNKLITQNANAVNEMDTASRMQLALIQKQTGIASDTIAQILENQIVKSGKATNDALYKITGYSDKLSKETGLSFELIFDQTTKVMKNMEQFGHVTVEEAQRISVQIQQLGMTFETFQSLTGKFQDFSTSITASGDISQLTGGAVQLDAQELAYLASEDQDEFLRVLRDSFLDSGFDAEQFHQMTNAEQRAIAQSMGMQRNEFAMLIGDQEVSSREQLDMMMKEAADDGAISEKGAIDRIKQAGDAGLDASAKTTGEAQERARRASMKRAKKYASESMQDFVEFQKDLIVNLTPPDIAADFSEGVMSGMNKSIKVVKDSQKSISNLLGGVDIADVASSAEPVGAAMGTAISNGLSEALNNAGLMPASLPPFFQNIVDETEKHLEPAMFKAFKIAGEGAAAGMKAGVNSAGVNPALLMKSASLINNIKTKPLLIQKNIERVLSALESVKKQDMVLYDRAMEELNKNLKNINENNEKLNTNQESLLNVLIKGKKVILKMDSRIVGETILDYAPEIETLAGVKFKTEI